MRPLHRMFLSVLAAVLFPVVMVVVAAKLCLQAQTTSPAAAPSPNPAPTNVDPQEQVRVYTEEVQIPVFANGNDGLSAPTLQASDLLVLEDDAPQQIKSVRRDPSNVLLLLDTAGGINPAMTTQTTRELAIRITERLREGDSVAAIQFGGRSELIQNWTTERTRAVQAFRSKLFSGRQSRLSEALSMAATRLNEAPAGNRHVVLITDGVEESGSREVLTEAIRQLLSVNATVHVISYTSIGRQELERRHPLLKVTAEKRKSAQDVAEEILIPTGSTDTRQRRKIYLIVDTDIAMRQRRKDYEDATERGEQWLTSLADETGGYLSLPLTVEELLRQGDNVAREIGTQYVVTYTPTRPLASATKGEYRRLSVTPRRAGLQLRTRRGYVAPKP